MSKTDFSVYQPLFHDYGVDLYLCGHQVRVECTPGGSRCRSAVTALVVAPP